MGAEGVGGRCYTDLEILRREELLLIYDLIHRVEKIVM